MYVLFILVQHISNNSQTFLKLFLKINFYGPLKSVKNLCKNFSVGFRRIKQYMPAFAPRCKRKDALPCLIWGWLFRRSARNILHRSSCKRGRSRRRTLFLGICDRSPPTPGPLFYAFPSAAVSSLPGSEPHAVCAYWEQNGKKLLVCIFLRSGRSFFYSIMFLPFFFQVLWKCAYVSAL